MGSVKIFNTFYFNLWFGIFISKYKKEINNKIWMCLTLICIIAEFILGYVLATRHFASNIFWTVFIIMIIVGILELCFIILNVKSKENTKKEKIKELTLKEIYSVFESEEDIDKRQAMWCLFYLGAAIILLCAMLFVVPIFIRNTSMELFTLFFIGIICYFVFCIANYKKYMCYYIEKFTVFYYIEISTTLICMIFMYYIDGFVYRGEAEFNIIINGIYVLLIMPFIISSKKISNNITNNIRRMEKNE